MSIEIWASVAKSRENYEFLVNFPIKDKSPSAVFTKLGAEESVPGPYPRATFHRCHF